MVEAVPKGRGARGLAEAVRRLYAEGETDYSLEPLVLVDDAGLPLGRIRGGDSVVFCCRRGEREVELTEAFTEREFCHFERPLLEDLHFVILTLYHEKFRSLPVAFAPAKLSATLGETLGRAGLRQLRVAETEKFAHVTFFLDGGTRQPFPDEETRCVPSPRGRAFEAAPALSSAEVAREVRRGIGEAFPFIAVNFANGDVLGHTANFDAKVRAAEAVDSVLAEVSEAALTADYTVFVTADHGNLEEGFKADGSPHVAHSTNLVPFVLVDPRGRTDGSAGAVQPRDGALADVAPTIVAALGLKAPTEMTGTSLLSEYPWGAGRRVLLVILDGWGLGREDSGNPIHVARTPFWDSLLRARPFSRLEASGAAVGLEPGKPGNSEAGHLNLGAGRVVAQDDVRLDAALRDGTFESNEVLVEAVDAAKSRGRALHLVGLLSERSSHGSIAYPLSLARLAARRGLRDVYLHLVFDGRSTEPGSAPTMLLKLGDELDTIGVGLVVTGIGRGVALDRAGDYAKIKRAYDALVSGTGRQARLA